MKYREDVQFHRIDLEAEKGQAPAQPVDAVQKSEGSALTSTEGSTCPSCGKPAGDTAFCTNCGASLKPG